MHPAKPVEKRIQLERGKGWKDTRTKFEKFMQKPKMSSKREWI